MIKTCSNFLYPYLKFDSIELCEVGSGVKPRLPFQAQGFLAFAREVPDDKDLLAIQALEHLRGIVDAASLQTLELL